MTPIESRIDTASPAFRANHEHMSGLVATLRARRGDALQREAGVMERHRRLGKLPVRERLARLLDPGAPFLELSPLAAHDMYGGAAPGAGLVTGGGRVSEIGRAHV